MQMKLQSVMLYVKDQAQAVKFWTEVMQFEIINESVLIEEYKSYEIGATKESETTIVLFDRAFIEKYSPGVTLDPPSLMFEVDDLEALYKRMKSMDVTVGELVEMPTGKVFNFSDFEGNYFAVTQKH
ncbi:glyoxalase/bleomycin resistance/extradiol dioxygenase family protein [Macrococcus epidermidis]|uniref:Glyoxalase/bleomycin resistance/extradiol dioxygenase family protein n=2 Tax=Macrococcus epidermidis TaxID=1902580 RepID=A0A327ZQ04_9STAP|nr:glyoxalase/bleomycin resistance/extradiol dioxygenase family protein [Macrococcus epidermidis]UTH17510.1 VOC family protein [Macrococcus epidermidis]